MRTNHTRAVFAACLAVGMLVPATASAWESLASWGSKRVVSFRINPQNQDVPTADVLTGFSWAARQWTAQTKAAFRFDVQGVTTKTTADMDGENVILFRNEDGPSASTRAQTFTWKIGSTILETDIVLWDKQTTFITGDTPCDKAIYLENTAIHELGHALGLEHSDVFTSAMHTRSPLCSKERFQLDPDDVLGAETLYPCTTAAQCNDGDPCTTDACTANKCQRSPVPGCGDAGVDAGAAPDPSVPDAGTTAPADDGARTAADGGGPADDALAADGAGDGASDAGCATASRGADGALSWGGLLAVLGLVLRARARQRRGA